MACANAVVRDQAYLNYCVLSATQWLGRKIPTATERGIKDTRQPVLMVRCTPPLGHSNRTK